MLSCYGAEGGTLNEHGAVLSREAIARTAGFINTSARPLERALFAFHFAHGNRDAVLAALAEFQNADGGFASCLESDTRWCGSSPLGAMKALEILMDIDTPATDPRVKAVVRYLLANFDAEAGMWHVLPKDANSAPHASWWEVSEKTGKCEVESRVFPTAALGGYLQKYSALVPPAFTQRITKSSLDYLAAAPLHMTMSDIESLIVLVRSLPPTRSAAAVRKLNRVLAEVVVQDPKEWNGHNVKPLTFVHSPQSPFYTVMIEKLAGANLEYIISTQKSDGAWALTWSWEERNPTAWKLAEKEWLGVVSLENLLTLQAFHRIESQTPIAETRATELEPVQ